MILVHPTIPSLGGRQSSMLMNLCWDVSSIYFQLVTHVVSPCLSRSAPAVLSERMGQWALISKPSWHVSGQGGLGHQETPMRPSRFRRSGPLSSAGCSGFNGHSSCTAPDGWMHG